MTIERPNDLHRAALILAREAHLLDRRDWEGWLELYEEDCIFWVPSWRSDTEQITDPSTETSLIYLATKDRLKERVRRVQRERTLTAQPMPRTSHMVFNHLLESAEEQVLLVHSKFQVHRYDPWSRITTTFYGTYEHTLVDHDGELRINKKLVRLVNDTVSAYLDFFCI